MIKLIVLDDNNMPVINRVETVLVQEFQALVTRRRMMKGDSEGRDKKLNTLELAYVYLYSEALLSESIYAAFDKEEKSNKIIKDLGLPDDWSPDEKVQAAITKYTEIQNEYSPSMHLLNSLQRGLKVSAGSIDMFLGQLNTVTKVISKWTEDIDADNLDAAKFDVLNKANTQLFNMIDKFMSISNSLPGVLQKIDMLTGQVRQQLAEVKSPKGGGSLGDFEDPD